jgi:predicted P-loop ATPase/GTPase
MKLLVAGGDRVDAGKTTFAAGLLAHLRETADTAPLGFKPRAGNDYWFDHDDVLAALEDGRLYGKDARRLAGAEGSATEHDRPEALNPLHRLWQPTPGETGLLGAPDRTFLVDRLRRPDDDKDQFVVNADATLPEPVREALPLEDARRVESVAGFNDVMAEQYLPAFDQLASRVRDVDLAVVESYSDIALPLADVEFDAVAVVDPGRVRVYDGRRWLRACEIASGSPQEGQLEERTADVTELTDPVGRVTLPALSSSARKEPAVVGDAYADAYVELLAAAQ